MIKKGLIVAGFDPSAGAGLLMDTKVFSTIGIYAYAVPTAIVEENTDAVNRITAVNPSVFMGQLKILLEHSYVNGVKIGMLYHIKTAKLIKDILQQYSLKNVILDPILLSSSGTPLLKGNAKNTINSLLPFCTIVTPNITEASVISGIEIEDKDDMLRSAKYFIDKGAMAVVIKGGHFVQKGLDLYMDHKQYVFLEAKALNKDVHGTGCIMSSAITAYLIKGHNKLDAVKKAKLFTLDAIKHSRKISASLRRYVALPHIEPKNI